MPNFYPNSRSARTPEQRLLFFWSTLVHQSWRSSLPFMGFHYTLSLVSTWSWTFYTTELWECSLAYRLLWLRYLLHQHDGMRGEGKTLHLALEDDTEFEMMMDHFRESVHLTTGEYSKQAKEKWRDGKKYWRLYRIGLETLMWRHQSSHFNGLSH